jgi:integral membrane protein (TIGR00529 family)
MDALKLVAILAAIIFALRKNLPVGITLFGAGLLTALLYQISVLRLLDGYLSLIKSERFLTLTAVIVLITIMGSLLKELGFLQRLADACRHLYGGRRTAVVILPFLIGLMPMPGGALLSAPLVGDVLKDPKYSPEFKTAANYWFRHLVEFFWPIYPGIILVEGITGMPMGRVALMQVPMSLIMLAVGGLFYSRKIELSRDDTVHMWRSLWRIAGALWPIAGAIALYGVFKVQLALSVFIALVALILISRPGSATLTGSVRKGLSYKLIFLVFGILSFQTVLELSGSIESLPRLAAAYHFPPELLIIVVCFTLGLLTGMVAAYIGMGFTLMAGFIYQPQVIPSHILLGYLAGYIGMILSPTHLCLIITNDYFKSNLGEVYKMMALPVIALGILGYAVTISFWPHMFVMP